MARQILKRLKFDNYTLDRVTRLVKWHGLKYDPTPVCVRRALNRVGADLFDDFMKVQRADILAKNPVLVPFKLDLLQKKSLIYHKVMEEGQCFETVSYTHLDVYKRQRQGWRRNRKTGGFKR